MDWPDSVKRVQRNWIGPSGGPYHLKDWLFSRQRYWGEPFPIVYDEADPTRPIALPEDMLPVTLPELTDFRPVPQDDCGVASTPEPFGTLFNQGYILADAFTDARGQYVPAA